MSNSCSTGLAADGIIRPRRHMWGATAAVGAAVAGILALGPVAARQVPAVARLAVAAQADPTPVAVAVGEGDQRAPALAYGGDGYLGIWETCDDCPVTGADLAVRPLGEDGVPVGPIKVIEDSPLDARSPGLAYNRDTGEYLAVWSVRYPGVADRYGVRALRLERDGSPISDTIRVADVVGVWPAAVVSSSGAWHGYDIAWAAPGPQPELQTTVIHTRHLDADGVPAAEVWRLSDPGYEALSPRAMRTSNGAGALVAWFAYIPGKPDDRPSLRGVRLGLSGRPIGAAVELFQGAVCAASLADHIERPELMMATVGCDGRLQEPSGALALTRMNRSGAAIGERVTLTGTVVARDITVAAAYGGDYLLVRPDEGDVEFPMSQTLRVQRFDADLEARGPSTPLGVGEGPSVAGDRYDGGLVLAARMSDNWDVVAYLLPTPPASPTPTAGSETPSPGPIASATATTMHGTTSTPTPTGMATGPTAGTTTVMPTVPTGTAGTASTVVLPIALRGQ